MLTNSGTNYKIKIESKAIYMEKKKKEKRNSKKGFTLIELLAVVIILGVLMMAAIPAVTGSINRSRRDTYATNAKKFIEAVRESVIDGDLFVESGEQTTGTICQLPANQTYVAVPLVNGITLERGGTTSSFGKDYKAGYIIIANVQQDSTKNDKFEYYFIGVDSGRNGITDYILENNINRSVVKSGNATDQTKINQASTGPITINDTSYTLDAICKES